MKILVVSQYFYPEQFRINDVCFELVKRGHDVTVLTGLPNYPNGEIYSGYEQKGNTSEIINGVRVVRCKLRPRHKGTINLIRNYFSFVKQANKLIGFLDKDFEIVYVYGISPITQALPALKYKRKYGAKVVYYCCDLWPEAVRGSQNGHKQLSKINPIYLVSKRFSKKIYKKVDVICTKCEEFNKYLVEICGADKNKLVVLNDYAESNYLKVKEHKTNDKTIDFFFMGNIGEAQRCDLIVEAASQLKHSKSFKIHFVGDGSFLEHLKGMVRDLSLEDLVIFHNKCSQEETIDYYNQADVCILTLSNKTATGLTPPAKLFSYMAAARPIVASIGGAAQRIIKEANCGFCADADNCEEFMHIIEKIITSRSRWAQSSVLCSSHCSQERRTRAASPQSWHLSHPRLRPS